MDYGKKDSLKFKTAWGHSQYTIWNETEKKNAKIREKVDGENLRRK